MVVCGKENIPLPPIPPPLNPLLFNQNPESVRSRKSSAGFRLQEQDETGSVYSVYKQKIDAMFESDSSSKTQNSVQARIEMMFTDIAEDNGIPMNDIGCHSFSVDYLGSVPLQDKVTSLSGLQVPLKELYFAYKKNSRHKKMLTGRLEISSGGLKVQYQGEKGDLEQLNSFPTIAVWSAVKFVLQDTSSFAFLPLITDPDNLDKQQLFRNLNTTDQKYISSETHSPIFAVVMRKIGLHKQLECHGFICQTSEDAIVIAATLYKALMAHMKAKEKKPKSKNGVTCMSMTSSIYNEAPAVPVRPPRRKRSTTSSVRSQSETIETLETSDTQPLIGSPLKTSRKLGETDQKGRESGQKWLEGNTKRLDGSQTRLDSNQTRLDSNQTRLDNQKPLDSSQNRLDTSQKHLDTNQKRLDTNQKYLNSSQKRSKAKRAAPKAPTPQLGQRRHCADEDLDAIVPYEEPITSQGSEQDLSTTEVLEIKPQPLLDKFNTYRSTHQKQITAEIKQVMTETSNMGLKRVKSVRKRADDGISKTAENSGDILTKVTIPRSGSFLNAGGLTRYKSKVQRSNGQASGGSPLGFSELFNEFRLQEGLHSVDEILGVIIDPDGMSFNDLKPIYKEFLLKLALTLTKDELYQRSKLIMRRHKKKLMKTQANKNRVPAYTKFKRLKHIFQKLKTKAEEKQKDLPSKLPESSISSSSYDTRHFQPKESKPVQRRQSYRKRNQKCRRDRASTSEESDFFSLKRRKSHLVNTQNRNSSSGYVSCSECSYDSDTCTCTSADKCYCSLGEKSGQKPTGKLEKCTCKDRIWCGCDTDSCAESNKCYCTNPKKQKGTIFEQLKQRGFIPTPQEIITPPNHRKLCKKNSNTKSTKSLEYFSNPYNEYFESKTRSARRKSCGGTDNLAVDYELFSIANGKICNINRSMYGRSEQGRTQSSVRSVNSYKYTQSKKTLQSIPVKGCSEALSVKKSAEIAALFADIKLSQTTDIAHLIPKHINMESFISYNNAYNNRPASRCSSRIDNPNDGRHSSLSYSNNRMINNTLYSSKNMQKANLYSTRNGLYTIQSQSDDSRSSGEQTNRRKQDKTAALENSLGYLP